MKVNTKIKTKIKTKTKIKCITITKINTVPYLV